MLHIKTYYLDVSEEIELSGAKAVPDNSRVIRFCIHTMSTYASIISKLSEVFLNIELGVQEKFITTPTYISIILPQGCFRKFKPTDKDTILSRIEWFIENFRVTSNGLIISIYVSKSIDARLDSHWNLTNLWVSKRTWEGKGDYVTVQFPEKEGNFWNSVKFHENWEIIEGYLISRGIKIKKISYETPIEEVHQLLLDSKLHISYIGSSYFIAALMRVPTIGLGKDPLGKILRYYRRKVGLYIPLFDNFRKNSWGVNSSMEYDRIMQIKDTGEVYNGFVPGSIDTADIQYIKRLIINVFENDDYEEFQAGMVKIKSNGRLNLVTEPWHYMWVDDYLPEKDFNLLKRKAMALDYENDKVTREIFDYDPTPQIELIFKIFEMIEEEDESIKIRPYEDLKKFIHFAVTPENFVHKMHVEAPFKIMSAVLYLGPEENRGTRLYKTPDGEPIEIEWKPNRLFVFCGHDHTFHDYLSSSVRYTYNWFLVDEPVVENPEYRENLLELEYIKE